jgi:twitching motility two-component system response regulator PilH
MREKKILIVEDDKDVAEMLEFILGDEGFSTRKLDCDREVFMVIEDFKPDLVLMDYILHGGGLNGGDICRRIKGDSRMSCIPVIIISAYTKSRIKGGLNCDAFIAKPFDLHFLVRQINSCLQLAAH